MKKITTILFLFFLGTASSQDTSAEKNLRSKSKDTLSGWDTGGTTSINITQTALSNWNAGGQNSLALNGLLSLFANHRTDNRTWENTLDVG